MADYTGDWPVEYPDQLIVGDPASSIAVCCLWSKRDLVAVQLASDQYAVIGQLYSRAGLNGMLRNILANPSIRCVVVTGHSLTDSYKALSSFFDLGVDSNWTIAGNGGQIDRDLPIADLNALRENVTLVDLRDEPDFAAAFNTVAKRFSDQPPFAAPRTYPKTVPEATAFPSEYMGFVVRQSTILEAWRESLWTIMSFGEASPTDFGVPQKEVLGLLSVIEQPSAEIEALPDWAPFTAADVEGYLDRFFKTEEQDGVAYNYGHRLRARWGMDQIDSLVEEIERSGTSRRALAVLWDPATDVGSAEPPCLTTVQVVLRGGRLYVMAYIRSNDMFRAYPLNAAALALLQESVRSRLPGTETGALSILSFSAHVYSDCWDDCRQAAEEHEGHRRKFEQDPRGSFAFRIEADDLVADHFTAEGDLVQTLRAKAEHVLAAAIAPHVSRVDHGLYLGGEVSQLAIAGQNLTPFDQGPAGRPRPPSSPR
ncbi:MAG: thymidylate synthase [Chloroflexota bacterium]|jgi:thymidylate synthase|nr:thymidylate synthase [Chloroflexota bacterium]